MVCTYKVDYQVDLSETIILHRLPPRVCTTRDLRNTIAVAGDDILTLSGLLYYFCSYLVYNAIIVVRHTRDRLYKTHTHTHTYIYKSIGRYYTRYTAR